MRVLCCSGLRGDTVVSFSLVNGLTAVGVLRNATHAVCVTLFLEEGCLVVMRGEDPFSLACTCT